MKAVILAAILIERDEFKLYDRDAIEEKIIQSAKVFDGRILYQEYEI